jgi:hypothetical protein
MGTWIEKFRRLVDWRIRKPGADDIAELTAKKRPAGDSPYAEADLVATFEARHIRVRAG